MWSEQDRGIYAISINGTVTHHDPQRILRLLNLAAGGKLNDAIAAVMRLQDETDPDDPKKVLRAAALPGSHDHMEGLAAQGVLAHAAYKAFNLQPIDPLTGDGVTEDVALGLLANFLTWVRSKKATGER